jgi:hypothetical protein
VNLGGIKDFLEGWTREGKLVDDGLSRQMDLGETQGGQSIEALLDGEVEMPPALC